MAVEPLQKIIRVPVTRRDENALQQRKKQKQPRPGEQEEEEEQEQPAKSGKVDITI